MDDTSAMNSIMDRLDRELHSKRFVGVMLDRAQEDRHRQMALQDEARKRAEYLSDVDSSRKFSVDQTQEARADKWAEETALNNRKERLDKEARRRTLQAVSNYPKDAAEWTNDDEHKARGKAEDDFVDLLQKIEKRDQDFEKALKATPEITQTQVVQKVLNDPASFGILKEDTRQALLTGKVTLAEVRPKISKGDWGKLYNLYTEHNQKLMEQAQTVANKEAYMAVNKQKSRYDIDNSVFQSLLHSLGTSEPGIIASAYKRFGATPPPTAATTAKAVGPQDPSAAYDPKGKPVNPAGIGAPPAEASPEQAVDAEGYPVTRQRSWWEPGSGSSVPVYKVPDSNDWRNPARTPEELAMRNLAAPQLGSALPMASQDTSAPPILPPGIAPGGFGAAVYRSVGIRVPSWAPSWMQPSLPGQPATAPSGGMPPPPLGTAPGAASPPPAQGVSQPQLANAIAVTKSLFGTLDQNYLLKVKKWYAQKSGMQPEVAEREIQATIEKAVRGDPDAANKIRSVMSQARSEIPGGDIDSSSPMQRGTMPTPEQVPTYNGPIY
jgi:hypothetical protein